MVGTIVTVVATLAPTLAPTRVHGQSNAPAEPASAPAEIAAGTETQRVDAERLFEASADDIANGNFEGAVKRLLSVATNFPKSRTAPEALFLAGELFEEQLDRPSEAADAYRRVTVDYPDSRVAVASSRRLASLATLIGNDPQDNERLGQFLAIRRTSLEIGDKRALVLAEELLASAPDWAGADQVRVWMAGVAMRLGDRVRAETLYRSVLGSSDEQLVFEVTLAAAELALERNDFAEARKLTTSIEVDGNAGRGEARREMLLAVDAAQFRLKVARAALVILILVPLLFLVLLGWTTRSFRGVAKTLWPPPIETIFLFPILVVFAIASTTGHHGIAEAVFFVGTIGWATSWLSGVTLRSAPATWRRRLGCALGSALAVGSAFYLALHRNDLIDLIITTVRFGPDV